MNNEIKEPIFFGAISLSVLLFFITIILGSEYNQLVRENEVLKERVKEQTILIEYLEKGDGKDEGTTRKDSKRD